MIRKLSLAKEDTVRCCGLYAAQRVLFRDLYTSAARALNYMAEKT